MKALKRPALTCMNWKARLQADNPSTSMHMNKLEKPTVRTKTRESESVKKTDRATEDRKASRGAVETLTDITNRSASLFHLYTEKLKSDDGYQVIDSRTVTATIQDLAQKALMDPTPIIKEQFAFWTDAALLWQRTSMRMLYNMPAEAVIAPAKQDKRFKNDAWTENWFFDYTKQHYLLLSRYVESSDRGVKGLDPHTRHKAQFYTRQFVNALSPTNFVLTNPTVLDSTVETRGQNLVHGYRNFLEDLERGGGRLRLRMTDLAAFKFGENIAYSPGKLVFQNELMQLIQYSP